MYQITTESGVLGYVETVSYCYKLASGAPQIIGPKERARGAIGTGLVYNSAVYNLPGHGEFDGAETAWIREVDAANALNRMSQLLAQEEEVSSIVFVALAESGDIDPVTAGEHADIFSPWEPDVKYEVGNLRQYDSQLWRCIQAHRSQADWTPDIAVSQWARAADPAEEWPEWSQPIGAADAYNEGDKVRHNGKHWISTVNANVWEPGVYGWTEKGE